MERTFLPLCILVFLLTACNQPRYVYNQNMRNVHFFYKKGQSRLSAALVTGPSRGLGDGQSNCNKGFDVQGAYAITGKFAVAASYYSRKEKDRIQAGNITPLVSDVQYKRSGWELGGSFFLPLDRHSHSFFHLDAGVGQTRNQFVDAGTFDSLGLTRNYANRNFRYFLQPGLYTGRGPVAFGMGFRLGWTHFSHITTSYTPAEMQAYKLSGLSQMAVLEPYAILRIGPASIPGLRFEIQGSFCSPSKDYYVRGGYVSFGVVVDPTGLTINK